MPNSRAFWDKFKSDPAVKKSGVVKKDLGPSIDKFYKLMADADNAVPAATKREAEIRKYSNDIISTLAAYGKVVSFLKDDKMKNDFDKCKNKIMNALRSANTSEKLRNEWQSFKSAHPNFEKSRSSGQDLGPSLDVIQKSIAEYVKILSANESLRKETRSAGQDVYKAASALRVEVVKLKDTAITSKLDLFLSHFNADLGNTKGATDRGSASVVNLA